MKRAFVVASLLLVAFLAPRSASAGPVTIVDPIIGVRGLPDGPSQDITNPANQGFVDCGVFYNDMSGYICAPYHLTETFAGGLFAVDLTFTQDGSAIPVNLLTLGLEGVDPHAGFTQFTQVNADTIRLFGGAAANGALSCGETACTGGPASPPPDLFLTFAAINPPDDAVVFIGPNRNLQSIYSVSLTNPQNTPVPEPGTLLLLGTGFASMATRRFRRKATA